MNQEKLICQNHDGSELSVPIEHTSMNRRDDVGKQFYEFGCDFGYHELLELERIVKEMKRQ